MLARRGERKQEAIDAASRWSTRSTLLAMQRAVEDVHVSESVRLYMVDLVRATRENAA